MFCPEFRAFHSALATNRDQRLITSRAPASLRKFNALRGDLFLGDAPEFTFLFFDLPRFDWERRTAIGAGFRPRSIREEALEADSKAWLTLTAVASRNRASQRPVSLVIGKAMSREIPGVIEKRSHGFARHGP
jgi:hypothetical protein